MHLFGKFTFADRVALVLLERRSCAVLPAKLWGGVAAQALAAAEAWKDNANHQMTLPFDIFNQFRTRAAARRGGAVWPLWPGRPAARHCWGRSAIKHLWFDLFYDYKKLLLTSSTLLSFCLWIKIKANPFYLGTFFALLTLFQKVHSSLRPSLGARMPCSRHLPFY